MNIKLFRSMCFLPLFACACLAPAYGEGYTLSSVLSAVEAANPSLSEARGRLGLLEAEAAVSAAYPNPELEFQKSIPGEAEYSYEVKATQRVPLTRRGRAGRDAALAELEAGRQEVSALEALLRSEARKLWYSLRIAIERQRFEQANIRFSMDLLNKIEMRFQTGEAGSADLARAKVEAERGSYRLQESESRIASVSAGLNSLMGRRPEEPVAVSEEDAFIMLPEAGSVGALDRYTGQALSSRLEPRALSLRAKSAGMLLRLEKGRRIPDPVFGFVRGREADASYSRWFLGMEVPLWYNNGGEIARANARLSVLDREIHSMEMRIRGEVYSAWLELQLASKRLSAAKGAVFLLNDLRRSASQNYISGKTGLTEFYETNRVFLEENINYLDALGDFYVKTANLAAAVNEGEGK